GPRDLGGEIADVHEAPTREHDTSLDHVLELADVARPRIRLQLEHGLFCKSVELAYVFRRIQAQKVMSKNTDVLTAFTQGRHIDRDHVQAVVEVLPEALLLHHLR